MHHPTSLIPNARQPVQGPQVHHLLAQRRLECVRSCSRRLTTPLTPSAANDVMTIANLIHLGMLTGRTTIVPPFAPSHVGRDAPLVPFSEIFDLPRLQAALRVPLVEWHEVKDIESEETDTLGCWSVWNTVRQQGPRDSLLYEVQRMGTPRAAFFCRALMRVQTSRTRTSRSGRCSGATRMSRSRGCPSSASRSGGSGAWSAPCPSRRRRHRRFWSRTIRCSALTFCTLCPPTRCVRLVSCVGHG
jgi:hypothetical protein